MLGEGDVQRLLPGRDHDEFHFGESWLDRLGTFQAGHEAKKGGKKWLGAGLGRHAESSIARMGMPNLLEQTVITLKSNFHRPLEDGRCT